jgi:hypothetical protein
MTGVTAMARMTALRMEQNGYDYPAAVVGPLLSQADITHISNEIPFMADCQVNASENNLSALLQAGISGSAACCRASISSG